MRLIIFGPPGAGKGTQSGRIAARYGVPAVSTGEIFRSNITERTELGRQVESVLAAGGYVSDEVTNAIIADRLSRADAVGGFLLDGYPRTPSQVDALDALLTGQGTALDAVLRLVVDPEVIIGRLLRRAAIESRSDDGEDVIRHRFEVYTEQTAPLALLYHERGLLVDVDGLGEVEAVTERIFTALDAVAAG